MDKPPRDDFDPYEREPMFAVSGDSAGRQWIMQLLQALILAGIVALFGIMWSFASSFAEIRVMLNEREKQNARDVARLESADARHDSADSRHDTELRGLDNRVTTLERAERADQPDAYDRQKRR
jgi:hypothetical protein